MGRGEIKESLPFLVCYAFSPVLEKPVDASLSPSLQEFWKGLLTPTFTSASSSPAQKLTLLVSLPWVNNTSRSSAGRYGVAEVHDTILNIEGITQTNLFLWVSCPCGAHVLAYPAILGIFFHKHRENFRKQNGNMSPGAVIQYR